MTPPYPENYDFDKLKSTWPLVLHTLFAICFKKKNLDILLCKTLTLLWPNYTIEHHNLNTREYTLTNNAYTTSYGVSRSFHRFHEEDLKKNPYFFFFYEKFSPSSKNHDLNNFKIALTEFVSKQVVAFLAILFWNICEKYS